MKLITFKYLFLTRNFLTRNIVLSQSIQIAQRAIFVKSQISSVFRLSQFSLVSTVDVGMHPCGFVMHIDVHTHIFVSAGGDQVLLRRRALPAELIG